MRAADGARRTTPLWAGTITLCPSVVHRRVDGLAWRVLFLPRSAPVRARALPGAPVGPARRPALSIWAFQNAADFEHIRGFCNAACAVVSMYVNRRSGALANTMNPCAWWEAADFSSFASTTPPCDRLRVPQRLIHGIEHRVLPSPSRLANAAGAVGMCYRHPAVADRSCAENPTCWKRADYKVRVGGSQLAHFRTSESLWGRTVTIDTVTDLKGLAALGPDFERLSDASGNRLPFALHEWHLTWCQHFLNLDPRIYEQPLFYVLRNGQRACVAIVPFILSRRRVGPIKVGAINLLGADPDITEIRAPLVEPGYESVTAAAVHNALEKVPDWDWVHWAHIGPELAKALSADGQRLYWQPPLSDFVIDLAPSWDEFRGRLKRNIRESLRHAYNSLKREGITFEFEGIEQPGEIRRGLDRFLELHRMRAEFACAVRHPNRFANDVCRDFLIAVCERLAVRRRVRLFALKVQNQVVAMRLAFVVADSLYFYYSGFDPRWWRFSVMTTTVAEAIKYAIANGFKTVNLSTIRERSKTRWGPRQIDYLSAYEPKRRLRSRLANSVYLKHRSAGLLQRIIPPRSWG